MFFFCLLVCKLFFFVWIVSICVGCIDKLLRVNVWFVDVVVVDCFYFVSFFIYVNSYVEVFLKQWVFDSYCVGFDLVFFGRCDIVCEKLRLCKEFGRNYD